MSFTGTNPEAFNCLLFIKQHLNIDSNLMKIYLDTAASYPLLDEVKDAMKFANDRHFANPSSSHILGHNAAQAVQDVRELLSEQIGALPSEVIFTSGATESNNISLKSILLLDKFSKGHKKHIITSAIEHKCIHAICKYLEQYFDYEITYVLPDANGLITKNAIEEVMRSDTVLISIMHANNELGTINPIAEIGSLCFENEVLFHVDAAQSFQKIDIDVDTMNVDMMSFSAHKIGGPKGVGAVYIRDLRHKELIPVIHGAGQESGLRGGSIPAPLIIGFGAAIKHFRHYYERFSAVDFKQYLCKLLQKNDIQFRVNGSSEALPSCLSITFYGINTPLFVRDNEQIFSLSQGSACSSKEIEPSHVLRALKLDREEADNTLRIKFD